MLAPRNVFRLEGDETRTGVVYAATDDGVYRYYGGGTPVCLDGSGGVDALRFDRGECPARFAEAPSLSLGDVIAADPARFFEGDATFILGEVECIAHHADLVLTTLDTPDPAPGRLLAILARLQDADYGFTSAGLVRQPDLGDCP